MEECWGESAEGNSPAAGGALASSFLRFDLSNCRSTRGSMMCAFAQDTLFRRTRSTHTAHTARARRVPCCRHG
jgi:hypothetical protein